MFHSYLLKIQAEVLTQNKALETTEKKIEEQDLKTASVNICLTNK